MVTFTRFYGIDISKDTLDIALFQEGSLKSQIRLDNKRDSLEKWLNTLLKETDFSLASTLFCCEHTGLYNYPLTVVLSLKEAFLWTESGYQIKQSLGLQRGKSDKTDAARIASYAYRFADKAQKFDMPEESMQQLSALQATRDRLLSAYQSLSVPLKESKNFMDKKAFALIEKCSRKSIATLKEEIKSIEQEIDELIDKDDSLKTLFALVTSVPGVGKETAKELLISTQKFTRFTSAKQLACYCGVAPFEHSSGSSLRGKTRVSHKANKRLKTLLHLGAMSAIQVKGELQDFYERKKQEKKNAMSILNAIRNKIIQRICAVVKSGKKYDKNYSLALVYP